MKRLPQILAALLLGGAIWLVGGGDFTAEHQTEGSNGLRPRVSAPVPFAGAMPTLGALRREQVQRRIPALPVTIPFVRTLTEGETQVSFQLPDGRKAEGIIEMRFSDKRGNPTGVDGRLVAPDEGRFRFRLQPEGDLAGPVTGSVVMVHEPIAFRVETGGNGESWLTAFPKEDVVCEYVASSLPQEPPQHMPTDHPSEMPIPAYQNGIVPLQSLPGAVGVIYLDFDGEEGPHEGWGDFDAESPNLSNPQVREVWERVAEDFAPFNLNVTTDLQVYLDAPENSRQRCIITPTTDAAPGYGGVAGGMFNSVGDVACWSFATSGKAAAEVISHEVGHTLGLYHDGRYPGETYYTGHGADAVGWVPIMGNGISKNLSQWSKGEYSGATETQDDLNVIDTKNNNVDFRTDDAGATHGTAASLEISGSNSFPLTVAAADNGSPPFSASAVATVTISNANILRIPPGDQVVWASGSHQFDSALIEGTLHLRGDAVFGTSGSMVNRGVLELIHWNGTLPIGLTNEGVILDRSAVKILSFERNGGSSDLTTPGYEGHIYQLKTAEDLDGLWTDSGEPVTGTGTPTAPQVIPFSAPASDDRRFYRVVVTPAP